MNRMAEFAMSRRLFRGSVSERRGWSCLRTSTTAKHVVPVSQRRVSPSCFSPCANDSTRLATGAVRAATRRWVDNFIVGKGVCPFVKPLLARNKLRTALTSAQSEEDLQLDFRRELQPYIAQLQAEFCNEEVIKDSSFTAGLGVPLGDDRRERVGITSGHDEQQLNPATIESTLLVVSDPMFLADYFHFYKTASLLDEIIAEAGLKDHLKIVLFHPRAVHNGYTSSDPFALRRRHVDRSSIKPPPTESSSSKRDEISVGGAASSSSGSSSPASRRGRRGRRREDSTSRGQSIIRQEQSYDSIEAIDEDSEEHWGPNLVLRAPHPTFHLLRECDLEAAKQKMPGCGELVPEGNRKRLGKWSEEEVRGWCG